MANNQNFIIRNGLSINTTPVINTAGYWVGLPSIFEQASFDVANTKTKSYAQNTAPSSPNYDDVWIDTSSGITYNYVNDTSGPQWVEFGPIGVAPTGNIVFSDQTITGSIFNRDITLAQQGTGKIVISSANTSITGNISSLGYFTLNNTNYSALQSPFQITSSNDFFVQKPINADYVMHITGKDGTAQTRVMLDTFGTGSYNVIGGRFGRGTAASPSATQNNDIIMRISGNGWGTTKFGANGSGYMQIVASENFTDTARGSHIEFWNNGIGTEIPALLARFNADTARFIGAVIPEKGFIFNVKQPTGNVTSLTISFSNDAMIRATVNTNMTISLTNYVQGKIVEVFITNPTNGQKIITHGCIETNASNNDTIVRLPSSSSMMLRYFSFDGDNANTTVAVIQG